MPGDEIYEKAVNQATVVYQLEGEGEKTQFVPIHENAAKMLQVSLLHPTRVSVHLTFELFLGLCRNACSLSSLGVYRWSTTHTCRHKDGCMCNRQTDTQTHTHTHTKGLTV